jgi:alpha 1,2-mannosyltransferase
MIAKLEKRFFIPNKWRKLKRRTIFTAVMLAVYFVCSIIYTNTISSVLKSESVTYTRVPKACIMALVHESDLESFKIVMTQLEVNFNSKRNYPFVILSSYDSPFSDTFKETVRKWTKSKVEFGEVSKKHWDVPNWIDHRLLNKSLETIGFPLSYRQMCRFYSGFFFRHELTLKYDYFMRIDHDSDFPCIIENDPFETLIKNNKTYGFVVAYSESNWTIPTLWHHIRGWIRTSGFKLAESNTIHYVSDDNGRSLAGHLCHFWNNFEVGAFSLFRSPTYLDYYNYLDRKGGFYYERWGDAPVHTYFINLMLDKSQVHLFRDIHYRHPRRNYPNKHKCSAAIANPECNARWISAI